MKKREDNQPGMDQKRQVDNDNYKHTKESARTGEQGRAAFHPGSATQGGSNHGQGSHYLAGDRYHQGDTGNAGSSYDNEANRFGNDEPVRQTTATGADVDPSQRGELPETREDIPHGQGAHVNEQEANAQEEYPGVEEVDNDHEEPERDII